MCRGSIPRRWRGYLGGKKVETVRSYKRNITKISVAKIILQRLVFDPCSYFLEFEPSSPLETPHSSRPRPCESSGDAMKFNRKIGIFYTRGRKQSFSSPAISVACSSFLTVSHPGSPQRIASPFPAWALLPHWVSKCFMSELQHSETRVCRREHSG